MRNHYALLAYDAVDGHQLWSRANTAAEPLYGFGTHTDFPIVPVTTYAGTLEALDSRSGRVRWRQARGPRTVGGATTGVAPVAEGTIGRLLITSNRQVGANAATNESPALDARDLRTGKKVWHHAFDAVPMLASDGDRLLALTTIVDPATTASPAPVATLHVEFLSLADGTTTQALDLGWSGFGVARVVLTPTTIVVGDNTNAGAIRGFDASTGALRWETNGILTFGSGEVVGRSLSSLLQNKIVALDAPTGTMLWERHTLFGTPSRAAVVLSDLDPYSGDGTITAVDTRSGRPLWDRSQQPLQFGGTTKGISAIADRGCPVADAA